VNISNEELKDTDIPAPDAELRAIGRFAETFEPAGYWRDAWGAEYFAKSQEMLGNCIEDYAQRGALPGNLAELRTCLALEWAILPYVSREPNAKQEQFLRDLVARIRELVQKRTQFRAGTTST
jgi:hypothetical protein